MVGIALDDRLAGFPRGGVGVVGRRIRGRLVGHQVLHRLWPMVGFGITCYKRKIDKLSRQIVKRWFRDIRKLADDTVLLLDVEGDGGLDGGVPVETSLIEVDSGKYVAEHRWLVDPEVPINKSATWVHGITDEMVSGCPAMEDVADEIVELIRGRTVIGLSIENDLKMLRKKIPGIDFMMGRIVDVSRMSYLAPSGRKNMGLDNLCTDLGIEMSTDLMPFGDRSRRHGASADAWLTGRCFFALIDRIRDADDAVAKEASLRGYLQMPPSREKLLRQELEDLGLPVPTGRLP
jgi:DNA polymerase III, epsilon subunit and related 3''-5'' exonucleases